MILTTEEKELLVKGKNIYFIELPEELKDFMVTNGGYELHPHSLHQYEKNSQSKMNTNKLCSCGLKFSSKYYNDCPICKNKVFKTQTISTKSFEKVFITKNPKDLKLKKKFFNTKYSYEKVSDNTYDLFREKQSYTYNWLNDEIKIINDDTKIKVGYIQKTDKEFFVFRNNKKEHIAIFASVVNKAYINEFIEMYNDLNKERPLPKINLTGHEASNLILDDVMRIVSEYFNVYIPNIKNDIKYKDVEMISLYRLKDKLRQTNDTIYPLDDKMYNIYTATNLPKSVLKYMKNKFGKEKDVWVINKVYKFFYGLLHTHKENVDIAIQLESLFGYQRFDMRKDMFYSLINEYNHDKKHLINYLSTIKEKQGIEWKTGLEFYYDYIDMSRQMSVKYTNFPKNLEKLHDIRSKDFRLIKDKLNDEKFIKSYENVKFDLDDLDDYIMVQPKKPIELTREGQTLTHCVASYVDRVINGDSLIFFLRKKLTPNNSLVTIEYNKNANRIVQARGKHNRNVTTEERKIIKKWAKENSIIY